MLAEAPRGVSGYNVTVEVRNGVVSDVEFPSWAVLKDNSTPPTGEAWFKACDLLEKVQNGSKNVTILKLRVECFGWAEVFFGKVRIDDDDGRTMDLKYPKSVALKPKEEKIVTFEVR